VCAATAAANEQLAASARQAADENGCIDAMIGGASQPQAYALVAEERL